MTTLLIIGSGIREYREYILESLAATHTLVLVNAEEPSWQRQYVQDWELAPLDDARACTEAARSLAGRHPLAGILTYDERAALVTAHTAQELGFPSHSPDTVARSRDKYAARQLLRRSGTDRVGAAPADSPSEALERASDIGYPVVLKPRSLAAGVGVIKANSAKELEAGFETASGAALSGLRSGGVIVEEFLDGPEFSAECVVADGETDLVAVARKMSGFAPSFEETGHTVSAADPLRTDPELRSWLGRVHAELGLAWGVTHVEAKPTHDGFHLIEVNVRMAGDLIPHLVRLATGVDLARAAGELALGRKPDLTGTGAGAAGVRFHYPPYDAVVTGLDPARSGPLPGWVERLVWETHVGEEVRLPPAEHTIRLAHTVVHGRDAAECGARLDVLEKLAQECVTLDPLSSVDTG